MNPWTPVPPRVTGGNWHSLFNQVPDLPEALISGCEEIWVSPTLRGWCFNLEASTAEELDVYARAHRAPRAIRAAMDDYRASPEDVRQNQADVDRKIQCPTLALWGEEFELVKKM